MLGNEERAPTSTAERQTLTELKRGVYVRRGVKAGEAITARDVFFAMPVQDGQLVSGDWRPGLVADRDYAGNAPLSASLAGQGFGDEQLVYQIMLQVRGMLNKANIHINEDAEIEISHHYRAAPLPRIWRRHRHLHQPPICQEAGDPAAAPEASLSLP